ncbi:diaminopimelate epimerase [candidate division KSB1 bacterium]|nr:diaminopimelate epimerase [candidate division KSB1 bacterium]MBL7094731.1 diaminopimelate epimerase [candidate division KSB1 bacterium]
MLKFTKISATGNDFILFDNRDKKLIGKKHNFYKKICQRRFSVGADGILKIEDSKKFDFSLKYYNSDGRVGEMCGNGARAAAYYAFTNNIAPADMTFEVLGVPYQASVYDRIIKLFMPPPVEIREYPGVLEEENFEEGGYLNVGVPHYVVFVPNVNSVDVERLGRKYRHHKYFQPWGTNVNFVHFSNINEIHIRTYERGVEEETLACGTGTISSAILAHKQKKIKIPMKVQTQGGLLNVYFDDEFSEIELEGTVNIIYSGELMQHYYY